MRLLKKILKIAGRALLFLVVFLGLYFLTAFVCSRITVSREADTKEEVTIYIKTNGVHTDIVMPVRTEEINWSNEFSYAHTGLRDTMWPWLAVGWGDKGFYLQTPDWADLKFSVAFNAAFGLSSSAIHATYYPTMKEGEDCRKIVISHAQYARLVSFVQSSLAPGNQGSPVYIQTNANYGISDAFYEAKGRYNLFRTCNTWTNTALKRCGQKCCLWTIFDTGIFEKYK